MNGQLIQSLRQNPYVDGFDQVSNKASRLRALSILSLTVPGERNYTYRYKQTLRRVLYALTGRPTPKQQLGKGCR